MEPDPTPQAAPDTNFALAEDTSWASARPLTLKSDDSFAVFGRAGAMEAGTDGLYHRDTRHLSHLAITLDQRLPRLLSAAITPDNALYQAAFGSRAARRNPDMGDDGYEILLRREAFLFAGAWHDRLTLTNWSSHPQRVTISITFAADFADLFEVRGTPRRLHGAMQPPARTPHTVTLACAGRDGTSRATTLAFTPQPDQLDPSQAVFTLDLAPSATARITVAITCASSAHPAENPAATFAPAWRQARRQARTRRRATSIAHTGAEIADAALRRARDDLIMLTTTTPNGPVPYAGVPWFSTVFGRDAIITALQVLWAAPALARGVLAHLAAHQARHTDTAADAEPGKILHEARDGDMANCGEVPFRRYYGSVDATPLFLILAGAYWDRTADRDFIQQLWPHLAAALRWIDQYGDFDGDGFVEYGRRAADGLINQGWKDSRDSIFHENGALARGPIALCEVQAYVFAAKQAASRIARALGMADTAAALAAQAAALRTAFDAAFWDDALGSYVLALDGAKKPCRVLASNAGHTLFAGIAPPERAPRLINLLMSPPFFSGWGIRTIAEGQPRYNPMSYHNGSVWPHDNALIGLGFRRYGRPDQAARLFDALLAAAAGDDRHRLPELFCGIRRAAGKAAAGDAPIAYPVACAPQAWAAGALPALLAACAGLRFDPATATAAAKNPVLPAAIPSLRFENLIVGHRRTSLTLPAKLVRRAGIEPATKPL